MAEYRRTDHADIVYKVRNHIPGCNNYVVDSSKMQHFGSAVILGPLNLMSYTGQWRVFGSKSKGFGLTLVRIRKVLLDIVNSLLHLGILGHVHVDHMKPLRTLRTELHGSSLLWEQYSSKHREPRLVESLGDGVPEPGVAAGDDHRATCRIEHLLGSSGPEDEQRDANDANHG